MTHKKIPKNSQPYRFLLLITLGVLFIAILLFSRQWAGMMATQKTAAPSSTSSSYTPKVYTPTSLVNVVSQPDKYVILDVRNKREYDRGHIPGAVHADYHDPEALKAAVGDKIPVTYCTYSAWRGPYAAYLLHKQGYETVGILNGGVTAWDANKGALLTENGNSPFIFPHPEPELLFPARTIQATNSALPTVTFKITAKKYAFVPNKIVVKQGQQVVLDITSIDVAHGFALPEYRIVEELLPQQTKRIVFVADRKGTFPFLCSVYCGHDDATAEGHYTMTGELIVQ